MSISFTNQVLTQIELFTKGAQVDKQVYVLPMHLDELVARLHLEQLGAKLPELRAEQAAYINVPVEGPYKLEHDRYRVAADSVRISCVGHADLREGDGFFVASSRRVLPTSF
jgi:hypothetical protein